MHASGATPAEHSIERAELRANLISSAHKRFGSIPAEVVVDHLLRSLGEADFRVADAALDALLRRWSFAQRDGLAIASRPAGGSALGAYTTGRTPPRPAGLGARRGRPAPARRASASAARPYTSVLESVAPLSGSCDCPDFLRSSLGLCKHLLVVLQHVCTSRRHLSPAATTRPRVASFASTLSLRWDPALPLSGPLDRLAGLRVERPATAGGPVRRAVGVRAHEVMAGIQRAFPGGTVDARTIRQATRRRDFLVLLDGALRPRANDRPPLLDASPAARAIVAEELVRVERQLRNGEAASAAMAHLKTLERRLYPYQREGVERFLRAGRLLLADDMGLGKTTQAIAACHALFLAGRVRRGLVIVPASLKPQWLREWQATTSVPAAVVDGAPDERVRSYRTLRAGFLIVNYELLLRDAEHIQRLAPELVVLDEAQRIKNYATKSAVYVKALAPEYRLVLTGTPMENRLEELASILDWVDDVALAPKWRLVAWHTRWTGDGGRTGDPGARNLATLRRRLEPSVVRRVRREVLAQLPPRTDTRVPVDMTPGQIDEHDALNRPIAQLLARARQRPLTQAEFLRLMQLLTQQRIIANGLGQLRFEAIWPAYAKARPDASLLEGLFSPKLGELRRLVTDLVLTQGRKVVVFSQWRRMLRLAEWSLRDLLGDAGMRAVFFTGAEKPSQRTQSIVDFHDDPRVGVMLLSDAGGVGLNLQRAASACINLELPWNPAVLEQRIGRIYRIGQKRPIDVYNLVSEGSIESRIAGLVGAKQALFSGLFDGKSDAIRFDATASFLTRVERMLDPGTLAAAPAPATGAVASSAADEVDETDDLDGSTAGESALDAAVADEIPTTAPPVAPSAAATSAGGDASAAVGTRTAVSTPDSGSPAALFAALRVERTGDGGVRIEAPPEVAGSLVALFDGMAKLLAAATDRS